MIVVSALFFFFLAGFAQTPDRQVDRLFLEKDRVGAGRLLLEHLTGMEEGSEKDKQRAKLKQLSEAFYSNRSLQLFEEALSSAYLKPESSLEKLQTIFKTEPHNAKILRLMLLIQLGQENCGASAMTFAKLREVPAIESTFLKWRILLASCKKAELVTNLRWDGTSGLENEVLVAYAVHAHRTGDTVRLQPLVALLGQRLPNYPEVLRFQSAYTKEPEKKSDLQQRYKRICSNQIPSKFFDYDPFVCKEWRHVVAGNGK